MNVVEVMDEIAVRLRVAPSLAGRTFAYPPAAPPLPPAAIVAWPTDMVFDATYGRGVDTLTGVVVVALGRPIDRSTRDTAGPYLAGSGPESVKQLLEGSDYVACDSIRVAGWSVDTYPIGAVEYLAAVFELEITGPGTA